MKKAILSDRYAVVKLFTDEKVEVHSMYPLTSDTALFTYKTREEAIQHTGYTNITIAAYVTAHARIKLYRYLDVMKENILYFDTDSIIFIDRPNIPKIKIGDLLGDMTDELTDFGKNAYITEFVSGGPKNYAFRGKCEGSDKEFTVCKVKGIRLNYINSEIVNFDSIKKLLFAEENISKVHR